MKNLIILTIVGGLFFCIITPDSSAAKKSRFLNREPANAQSNSQIDYVRTNIILRRKSMPGPKPAPASEQPMPWQHDESIIRPTPEETEQENPDIVLDVEIRDGMSLYNQSGWFNLTSYSEKQGVMMAFSKPDLKPIVRSTQYAPVDILFIDKQGTVTQIVPNILLSDLEDDIYPSAPILAFLFLKGGTCAYMNVNVGDEIQYSLFKKPPLILNSPPAKEPQSSQRSPLTIEKF